MAHERVELLEGARVEQLLDPLARCTCPCRAASPRPRPSRRGSPPRAAPPGAGRASPRRSPGPSRAWRARVYLGRPISGGSATGLARTAGGAPARDCRALKRLYTASELWRVVRCNGRYLGLGLRLAGFRLGLRGLGSGVTLALGHRQLVVRAPAPCQDSGSPSRLRARTRGSLPMAAAARASAPFGLSRLDLRRSRAPRARPRPAPLRGPDRSVTARNRLGSVAEDSGYGTGSGTGTGSGSAGGRPPTASTAAVSTTASPIPMARAAPCRGLRRPPRRRRRSGSSLRIRQLFRRTHQMASQRIGIAQLRPSSGVI